MNESFTKMPNSIIDIKSINIYERSILVFIARKTIGWDKKSDGISLSQFAKALGISKPTVLKTIESLKKRKFIKTRKQYKNGLHSYTMFNLVVKEIDKGVVKEIDNLVKEIDKGGKGDLLGVVNEVDTQQKLIQKKLSKEERKRDIKDTNIIYTLSDNQKLKEIDSYIESLIDEQEYIKSETGFKIKVKKKFDCEDKHQLEDFEKYYLNKECDIYKSKYIGNYIDDVKIENIYPFFETDGYNPDWKFIISYTDKNISQNIFNNKQDIENFLRGATDEII